MPGNAAPFVIQALSVSGVEESTTLEEEPTHSKICHLGRFLDSFSLARNDMRGVVPFTIQAVFGITLKKSKLSTVNC